MKWEAKKQNIIIISAVIVVIAVVLIMVFRGSGTRSTGDSLQDQIENSAELRDVVKSERNNFDRGSYDLRVADSSITWTYGELTGSVPVTQGTLNVLPTGRIEGFDVTIATADVAVIPDNTALLQEITGESILNTDNYPTATMRAATVLPNTVDDAFTIAYTLAGAGKSTSLASGMYVEHGDDGQIIVRGDTNISPQAVGFPDETGSLKLTIRYVFEK